MLESRIFLPGEAAMKSCSAGLILIFCSLAWAQSPPSVIHLDRTWLFKPDTAGSGLEEQWFSRNIDLTGWVSIQTGRRWEDQGYPDLDGAAWFRKEIEVPESWKGSPIWLVLGGVNDEYDLFCNGSRVNSFGEPPKKSVASNLTVAELSPFLHPGEKNLLVLRVIDWSGSGGIQRDPCFLTIEPQCLPPLPKIACQLKYPEKQLQVECDLTSLGRDFLSGDRHPLHARFVLDLRTPADPVQAQEIDVQPGSRYLTTVFKMPAASEHFCQVRVSIPTGLNSQWNYANSQDVHWNPCPTWDKYPHLKIRNNFVTDLSDIDVPPGQITAGTFPNPRSGWVCFSITAENSSIPAPDSFSVHVDSESQALIFRANPNQPVLEAMRMLPEGNHSLEIESKNQLHLNIRTIPELAYTYYPSSSHLKPQGPYDWKYLERYILPQANTLVTTGGAPPEELESWHKEGRQWLANAGLPGLGASAPQSDAVCRTWLETPVLFDPPVSGIIVDEFMDASPRHYQAWKDAWKCLVDHPNWGSKVFYAFSGDIYHLGDPESREFCRALLARGDRFAVEKYFPEEPSLEIAQNWLVSGLQTTLLDWKNLFPGFEKHLVYCLGDLTAPPESLNTNPGVDLKVYMDMQMHFLATDPAFWGLFGLMQYTASYADEEIQRYAFRLFRHYCIEGSTERMNQDPYHLTHLINPDFEQGLNGWEVQASSPSDIHSASMEGFSWLQGRYPRTSQGDHFALIHSGSSGQIRLSQKVLNLKPGRPYSLKFITADLDHLDRPHETALSFDLEDVQLQPGLSFKALYPSCYSHTLGDYNREHPAYFTCHRIVFYPERETSNLKFSPIAQENGRDDPPSGRIALNFVEIQPFEKP